MKKANFYEQPDGTFHERSLVGTLENVSYSLNSNLRVWYNTQADGYAPHQHSALEIIVPMESSYTIIISDKTFTIVPGDILIIPRLSIHEILEPEGGSRFIYMFNTEPLSGFQDSSSLEPVLMEPRIVSRQSHPGIYEHLYSCLMQINDIYFSNNIFWEYSVYSLLINILTTLGRDYYQTVSSGSDASAEKYYEYYQKFTSLLSYIDTHISENLTLEKMADYMGFSKYHFSRLFKEHTGSTFYDYLSRKRIQAAQTLLTTSASITDIAFQTGFNSSTSFGRCFKKYTKHSPSEYRVQFIEEAPPILVQL